MAGSRRIFRYTNDADDDYGVVVDESNAEATVGGIRLMENRSAVHPDLPRKATMRYVNAYLTSNPLIRRRFWVGNFLAVPQLLAGTEILAVVYPAPGPSAGTAEPWTVTSYRGEKFAPPLALNTTSGDTGLDDGDDALDA